MSGKADEGDDGKGGEMKKKRRNSFSGGLLLPENDSGIFRPHTFKKKNLTPTLQESKKESAFPNLYPDPTYKIFSEPLERKKKEIRFCS
jgi:hypothetical protein